MFGTQGCPGLAEDKVEQSQGMLGMSLFTVILAMHCHSCCMGRLSGATVPLSGEIVAVGVRGLALEPKPCSGVLYPGVSPLVLYHSVRPVDSGKEGSGQCLQADECPSH